MFNLLQLCWSVSLFGRGNLSVFPLFPSMLFLFNQHKILNGKRKGPESASFLTFLSRHIKPREKQTTSPLFRHRTAHYQCRNILGLTVNHTSRYTFSTSPRYIDRRDGLWCTVERPRICPIEYTATPACLCVYSVQCESYSSERPACNIWTQTTSPELTSMTQGTTG